MDVNPVRAAAIIVEEFVLAALVALLRPTQGSAGRPALELSSSASRKKMSWDDAVFESSPCSIEVRRSPPPLRLALRRLAVKGIASQRLRACLLAKADSSLPSLRVILNAMIDVFMYPWASSADKTSPPPNEMIIFLPINMLLRHAP